MNNNTIILTDGESYEVWGSLVELCEVHDLNYSHLKRIKWSDNNGVIEYKGLKLIKTPFRKVNGVKSN